MITTWLKEINYESFLRRLLKHSSDFLVDGVCVTCRASILGIACRESRELEFNLASEGFHSGPASLLLTRVCLDVAVDCHVKRQTSVKFCCADDVRRDLGELFRDGALLLEHLFNQISLQCVRRNDSHL